MIISKKQSFFVTLTLLISMFLIVTAYAINTLTIQRERAVLREGPGSFYDILTELPVGSTVNQIEDEEGWYKVNFRNLNGFISPRMTQKAPPRQDVFSQMGVQETSLDVSQHAMSAGIKGFAERFTNTFQGDKSFVELALTYQLDARRYRDFRRDTYRSINLRRIRRSVSIPKKNVPEYYTIAEEGLGLGIASRIASLGIFNHPVIHEYVNLVGNLVVEASNVYDNTFKFFILDIDNPNAYACPGGIIFITRGMLEIIETEAELALVLAHEIAHNALFHGVIEMEHRKHHIGADDAFAQMDSFFDEHIPGAIDDDTKDLIAEMEELSFKIYETLIEGRLDDYEEEADLYGMIYAIRAGYAPQGFINLLERLIASGKISNNEHYTDESNRMRIEKMSVSLRNINIPSGLLTHRDRYQSHKRQ